MSHGLTHGLECVSQLAMGCGYISEGELSSEYKDMSAFCCCNVLRSHDRDCHRDTRISSRGVPRQRLVSTARPCRHSAHSCSGPFNQGARLTNTETKSVTSPTASHAHIQTW